jgi:RimJ/RimL family protein N-acetyltransferase
MIPVGGGRIRFRELAPADALWLTTLNGNPAVKKLLIGEDGGGFHGALKIIGVAQHLYQHQPGYGFWAALDERNYLIGVFSLLPTSAEAQIPGADMGVRLLPSYWGKWYGVEGGRSLSRHVFEVLKLSAVYAHTHPENLAAQAISVRVGFEMDAPCNYYGAPAQRLRFTAARYHQLQARREQKG